MYTKILVSTDGSELATNGITHAVALAKLLKASLFIVTVTELWPALEVGYSMSHGNKNVIQDFEDEAAKSARLILDKAGEVANSQGVECKLIHVPDKHPAEGIIAAAEEAGANLIVMASHGRRGVRRLLLGSQAAEVIAHSKVPVLIIR
jgi:nucleotide-binding universal stress UspA family protein